MSYKNLAAVVRDLEARGELVRLGVEVDADLEAAAIQRRVFAAGGPAILFERVTGTPFPMLGNLFGTMDRARYIFRHALRRVETLFALKADPMALLRELRQRPGEAASRLAGLPRALWDALPRTVKDGPALAERTSISALPKLKSWPLDGGGYITLPQVYTEDPERPGFRHSNLGMYRVQLSGGAFAPDREVGLHYQIHRGIGPHHAKALARGEALAVNIFVGGQPALTLAAVMPLPEDLPELFFAGVLGGRRVDMIRRTESGTPLICPAEADFVISGVVQGLHTLPEGPFGDHLGYYSLAHDFPVLTVTSVHHRPGAVWPFTTVGRPPQEDTVFGTFIHELTAGLVPTVFAGVHEVHAVDAAGVHPLLLAVGSERYVPYAAERAPQELLTNAMALLGTTQTALAKYLLIAAHEDSPTPSAHDIPSFFAHVLERVDLERDLHFITRTTVDTLDYSGTGLNQGSKLIIAAAGAVRRELARELPVDFSLPEGFGPVRMLAPGIMVIQGPRHDLPRGVPDPRMAELAERLAHADDLSGWPLAVVADDAAFTADTWDNFLWVAFTRSDPATDSYGAHGHTICKHWVCREPLILDARRKSHHAPPLEVDPDVERRVDALAAPGGPLAGIL